MDEKIMNLTLRKTKMAPRTKRATRAIKEIRAHVKRHMKTTEDQIWIDHRLNEAIWARGIQNPPHSSQDQGGQVRRWPGRGLPSRGFLNRGVNEPLC